MLPNSNHSSNNSHSNLNEEEEDDSKIFPQRLMAILSDETNLGAICWLPHGKSFIIRNRKLFSELVMPKYFSRKAKYSSFTRKLNRWNFTRVSSGPELGSYHHEFFLRDKPHLAAQMFCKNARTMLAMAASAAPSASLSNVRSNSNGCPNGSSGLHSGKDCDSDKIDKKDCSFSNTVPNSSNNRSSGMYSGNKVNSNNAANTMSSSNTNSCADNSSEDSLKNRSLNVLSAPPTDIVKPIICSSTSQETEQTEIHGMADPVVKILKNQDHLSMTERDCTPTKPSLPPQSQHQLQNSLVINMNSATSAVPISSTPTPVFSTLPTQGSRHSVNQLSKNQQPNLYSNNNSVNNLVGGITSDFFKMDNAPFGAALYGNPENLLLLERQMQMILQQQETNRLLMAMQLGQQHHHQRMAPLQQQPNHAMMDVCLQGVTSPTSVRLPNHQQLLQLRRMMEIRRSQQLRQPTINRASAA